MGKTGESERSVLLRFVCLLVLCVSFFLSLSLLLLASPILFHTGVILSVLVVCLCAWAVSVCSCVCAKRRSSLTVPMCERTVFE
jgi:hypothetical protein